VSVVTRGLGFQVSFRLRLYSAVFCEFGTDLAWRMEALLRERRRDKLFMCLSGEKSEGVL